VSEAESFQGITAVQVGDRVEVLGDRPYAGVVTAVSADLTECTLKYYEVGKEVTLPLTKMRKLVSKSGMHADQVGPGLKCQCRFAADRKWYDVVVDALTPHGYMVTYPKFGTKEEVPLEYLRHTPTAVLMGDKTESSTIAIPENLKILPTDTEEEKLKKKKRIKGIKSKHRLQSIDKERSAVQNTWKAFTTKSSKQAKKSSTGIPHVKKRSMFASPEEVEGRVGVTRSGQGMTQVEERKRYKLNGPN
jgi:survival-of-motor-neuron-related-splicing factor 30